jgi:hypothetical protein
MLPVLNTDEAAMDHVSGSFSSHFTLTKVNIRRTFSPKR